MKIARYLKDNKTEYGVVRGEKVQMIEGDILSDFKLKNDFIDLNKLKLISPVKPPNIIAIGLNYGKHAMESTEWELPKKPVIFIKSTNTIIGTEDNIVLPAAAPNEVDYEAELAIIISKKAKNIEHDHIKDYILGYTCANDVSARDCQLRIDKQWARGKSFDTFCPLGPWIETELKPDNLRITSRLNGITMQDSTTNDMIFPVEEIVYYLSKNMTLLPGTVILTGTPEGVGFARKPPVFLKKNDIIEIEIDGIGVLKNKVVEE